MLIEAAQRLLAQPVVEDEGIVTHIDYWAKQGAGALITARSTGRFLLPFRSAEVGTPHTWGTWGGSIDGGESAAQTVRREVKEEAGYHGPLQLFPLLVFRSPDLGAQYNNYLAIVDEEFDPILNWETDHAIWTEFGHWPTPQHPGLETLLNDERSMQAVRHHLPR